MTIHDKIVIFCGPSTSEGMYLKTFADLQIEGCRNVCRVSFCPEFSEK